MPKSNGTPAACTPPADELFDRSLSAARRRRDAAVFVQADGRGALMRLVDYRLKFPKG